MGLSVRSMLGSLAAGALLAGGTGPERVVVTPRCMVLLSGQSCTFRARFAGLPARPESPGTWRWTLPDGGGTIHEATGAFTAPRAAEVLRIRVRAAAAAGAEALQGEAWVTVLPDQPFDLVGKVLGAGWLEPFSADLPFLDLESGVRYVGPEPTEVLVRPRPEPVRVLAGTGLPVTLRWRPPSGAVAQLLSYREGGQVVRRDVTGLAEREVVFRAPVRECLVEALGPAPASGTGWVSQIFPFAVDVRGLFPFAGDPLAEPGHVDGSGLSARFRAAFDAVSLWQRGAAPGYRLRCHVTDPDSHVVRTLDLEGGTATLCGEPGRPGHRDSPGLLGRLEAWLRSRPPAPVRFNRPTHLAVHWLSTPSASGHWTTLVADSGNHVLRRIDEGGAVTTLAGVPELAGHRDSADPRTALFADPRGLAVDEEGRIYVADRANQVIRRIAGDGVTTLAGSPGQAGIRDDVGAAARFRDLKGLAWAPTHGARGDLYVLDGDALRRLRLADLAVTTVAGQVDRPGFRDVQPGADAAALRQPCLRDPVGVRWAGGSRLLLADRGNRAVRRLDLARGELRTLLGDPTLAEPRWGLPRDGAAGPPGPDCAALEAPSAVLAAARGGSETLLVCSGRAVLDCRPGLYPRDQPSLTGPSVGAARAGQPVPVSFSLLAEDVQGWPNLRAFRYTVDLVDPCGDLAERHRGEGNTLVPVQVSGTFTGSGTGLVHVHCVTEQGVSAWARAEVPVAD